MKKPLHIQRREKSGCTYAFTIEHELIQLSYGRIGGKKPGNGITPYGCIMSPNGHSQSPEPTGNSSKSYAAQSDTQYS